MKNDLTHNNSGMILMTVLMIVMVMMIFTITILTQSLSQSTTVQKQIEQIREDQLAKGAFWQIHSASGEKGVVNKETTIDGKVYSTSVSSSGTTYKIDVTTP